MMQHFGECLLPRYSPDHITPEVEKQTLFASLRFRWPRGCYSVLGACQTNPPSRCCSDRGALFECCFVSDSNHPWLLQFQCPKRNIQCKSVEFDNIKIFYYPTWPDHLPPVGDTWNFYIARSGASPSESIDWATEGIDIVAYGLDGRWDEYRTLSVTPGTRVRISYTFRHQRRTREIVFPSSDPPVHTFHLEHM